MGALLKYHKLSYASWQDDEGIKWLKETIEYLRHKVAVKHYTPLSFFVDFLDHDNFLKKRHKQRNPKLKFSAPG